MHIETFLEINADGLQQGGGLELLTGANDFLKSHIGPDAEAILRETGARVASRHFEKTPAFFVTMVRTLPRALGFVILARSARKLLRNITGSSHVDVRGKPLVARLHQPATAMLEPAGVACALYGAAFEELASLYVGKKGRVAHSRCVINGGSICQWTLDI